MGPGHRKVKPRIKSVRRRSAFVARSSFGYLSLVHPAVGRSRGAPRGAVSTCLGQPMLHGPHTTSTQKVKADEPTQTSNAASKALFLITRRRLFIKKRHTASKAVAAR